MNIAKRIAGLIFAVTVILVLMITSVEIVTYGIPGYYRHEYNKYQVSEDTGVSTDDLVVLSGEMMSYLRGNRTALADITTTVDGVPDTYFFNASECAHMLDVRILFMKAISMRYLLLAAALACGLFLWHAHNRDTKKLILYLCKAMLYGSGIFLAVVVLMGIIISTDFNKYFVFFHHIFFSQGNWMFDPSTSRMINMLPEGFFMDTAMYISLVFVLIMIIIIVICYFTLRGIKSIIMKTLLIHEAQ